MKTFWAFSLFMVAAILPAADTNSPPANRPPARPGLEIKASFSIFDLKARTVFYSNNVVLVDPPAKPGDAPTVLLCQELTARSNASNKIDTIVAERDVQIDRGDMHARGERAVYTTTNEQFVLTGGQPTITTPQGTSTGDKIIYDRIKDKIFFVSNVTTTASGAALTNANSHADPASTNKTRAPKTAPGPGILFK